MPTTTFTTFTDSNGTRWSIPYFDGPIVQQDERESASEMRAAAFASGWHD